MCVSFLIGSVVDSNRLSPDAFFRVNVTKWDSVSFNKLALRSARVVNSYFLSKEFSSQYHAHDNSLSAT